jgi:zinc transport system permease protein
MTLFFSDLVRYSFLQYAVVAACLASIACGIMGSYVVVRRSTYVAGAISHCVLGGMGVARYLQRVHGVSWMTPFAGAVAAAVMAALIVGGVTLRGRERSDTVLSAVWAVGMAVGISFIMATPGYGEDLMSYLFGNILMVAGGDLVMMGVLNIVIVTVAFLFFNQLLAISFNEQLARLRGIRADAYELLFLVLTALTIVLLVRVVGVIMVIALLTLPAATAGYLANRLSRMMQLSVLLCLIYTLGGLMLSYGPEWPAGATIIELAGGVYLVVVIVHALAVRFR